MRRFLHRKGQQAKPGVPPPVPGGGHSPSRLRATGPQALLGQAAPSPITGRVRAPALRSRSMSLLYGPEADTSNRNKRFTRSLSFCDNSQIDTSNNCARKLLTQSEEDEVFRTYTRKLYVMFAALGAVIAGFVIYAYMYNTGSERT